MQILTNKNNHVNTEEFITQIYENEWIEGAQFNISMTKDHKLILLNDSLSTEKYIENISSKTYQQIVSEDTCLLETALTALINLNKKIVLNILPLNHNNDDTAPIEISTEKNKLYIKKLEEVLSNFPGMNIDLASISNKLIYHMKHHFKEKKIGIVMNRDCYGYEDLDFYIFDSPLYEPNIFLEQLKRKKELMLHIKTKEELKRFYNLYYKNNIPKIEKEILNHIYYITDFPETFKQLFL